jgi:NTP pyrophosphatase (non-canonical NTP hydrolase)
MEPVTAVTSAWTIAKTAGEISKKLYELARSLKDREAKQQIDEITDRLRELKQLASELEDENRDLREKLRFKSDGYEFRTPFWYDKAKPERALCPKCFANKVLAPMDDPGQGCTRDYRLCLVCGNSIEVKYR